MVSMLDRLPVLDRKLFRDVWRLRGQAFAIALVIAAGVGMMVMSFGMLRSLETTRDSYYDRYQFADIMASAVRIPRSQLDRIRDIAGVNTVEGRLTAGATLDIPGFNEPVSARIHSIPLRGRPNINGLALRSGRLPNPERPQEVVILENFADAARLAEGDTIEAVIYGTRQQLQVVGTVLSPEYVYAIGPGQIAPDNRRFGVIWMGVRHLAAALDATDSFNEALVRLERGASAPEVVRKIDIQLERYGGVGARLRSEHISDRFLSNEFNQLAIMAGILPPIFLAVAAFLINIVLVRLIDTEREVVGLLLAFGFSIRSLMLHYGKLALALSLPGLLLGLLLGGWLGRGLAGMYQDFFVFPLLIYRVNVDVFVIACFITLLVVLLGVLQSLRRLAKLTPAEAMRPPAPPNFAGPIPAMIGRWRGLDEPTKIILRSLLRRPVRAALGSAGIAAALGLFLAATGLNDGLYRMLDLMFDQGNRADMLVVFNEPLDERALFAVQSAPGVLAVEPFRAVSATLRAGPAHRAEALTGQLAGADLNRLVTVEGEVVEPPASGILISREIAKRLQLEAGDELIAEVNEGRKPHLRIKVAGILESPISNPATIDYRLLAPKMYEAPLLSGAYLHIDENQEDALFRYLKNAPQVAGVSIRRASIRSIVETVQESMNISILFNTGFAALIVFGVIYNNARISLAENARDLVSLRVLGYRRNEAIYILIGELAIILLAAIPLGIAFGHMLARELSTSMGGDLFIIPFALADATIAQSVLITLVTAIVCGLFVRQRFNQLDLVSVLKTRE